MSKMLSSQDYHRMFDALKAIADDPDAREGLGEWAFGFVQSIDRKLKIYLNGSIMDLSQKQLDKIEELHDQHC